MTTATADIVIKTQKESLAAKLAQSYAYCAKLARASGSNFYYGMLLTPKAKRDAMFAVYAWMREIDDIADSHAPRREKARRLIDFYRQTQLVFAEDLGSANKLSVDDHWLAFRKTIEDYRIPFRYFKEMFLGQLQTIRNQHFKTFADLYQYCYRVASTVGLICITIWGYTGGQATEKLAEYRGIALQLTNILRDLYQDAVEGLVYIPDEFFLKHHVSPKDIMQHRDRGIDVAVEHVIDKANQYYQLSDELEQYVAKDGWLCLRVMTEIYHTLFNKIVRNPKALFTEKRARINAVKKLSICLWSSLKYRFCTRGK